MTGNVWTFVTLLQLLLCSSFVKHRNTRLRPLVQIRLPSVLMFLIFCITFPVVVTIWNPRKKTNDRASEYDIYIAFPFSVVTIIKPKKIWASQWVCSGVRVLVTNTCTPVNALCMSICIWFNSDTFSTERSQNYENNFYFYKNDIDSRSIGVLFPLFSSDLPFLEFWINWRHLDATSQCFVNCD
jgi:hypothetical protein